MDFFGAQDDARRNTWRLAALFTAAVLCLVLLTNVLIAIAYGLAYQQTAPGRMSLGDMLANLPPSYWLMISAGVIGLVALASGVKYLQVRSGGRAIAESLGGRLLHHGTADFRERRLLNVVEEMAIASGMPVPPVYVVDEPSINAFAAGFGPDDAVVGINRGTLEHLNREELQGVVAHEFSHILNGDSRINLRLIAVLYGILFIGLVGRGIVYGVGRRGARRRGRSSGGAPVLALGVGLLVIGYAGTFFGNLIKAAVSRQRELLADAASVQFTRNPGGIAGALKKIGGVQAGSTMSSSAAREASHIFFGQAQKVYLTRLMATHPPLEQRIRAVEPSWDGTFPLVDLEPATGDEAAAADTAGAAGFASGGAEALEVHASPDDVAAAVGRVDGRAVSAAVAVIGGLPQPLRDAAHDPFAARALLYGLVLDHEAEHRQAELELLDRRAEPGVPQELRRLLPLLKGVDEREQLTLVEMAIPALKTLSESQYRAFIDNLIAVIKSDRRIDLMEWVLHRLLVKELRPHFEPRRERVSGHRSLRGVAREALVLISALARAEAGSAEAVARAFAAGCEALGLDGALDDAEDPSFARLNRALAALRGVKPLQKPRLIKACAATVLADGRTSAREGALLQGVAAALDCPLPASIYGEPRPGAKDVRRSRGALGRDRSHRV